MIAFLTQHWLDILGTLVGLVYIYQEYKASIWLWVTGIVMPIIYMFVYLDAGLYADFGMQVYYALAAIYGLLVWKFGKKKDQQQAPIEITHIQRVVVIQSAIFFLIAWGALYLVLIHFTNSTVPDSIRSAMLSALSVYGGWHANISSNGGFGSWWIWS